MVHYAHGDKEEDVGEGYRETFKGVHNHRHANSHGHGYHSINKHDYNNNNLTHQVYVDYKIQYTKKLSNHWKQL